MRTGLFRIIMISSMIFVLAGCGDASSQIENNIETLEESSLQQELQSLIDYERELQQDFETALTGGDLSAFSDASAEVFPNIDSRNSLLDSLKETSGTYEEVREELENLSISEEEQEIGDTVDSMINSLESVDDTMQSFIPKYEAVLINERDYFDSLGGPEADYESLNGGLDELNGQHEEINDFYHIFDGIITGLNEDKNHALGLIRQEGDS